VEVQEILKSVCEGMKVDEKVLRQRRGGAWIRGIAAEMLCRYGGLTQVAAARRLGLTSGAAVCIRRRELRDQRKRDRTLDEALRRLETSLVGRAGLA